MAKKTISNTFAVSTVEDGDDGNGIVSITNTYAISSEGTTSSDTTAPSIHGSWSSAQPTATDAYPYLWKKEVTVYTDTSKNTTKYYCIGTKGKDAFVVNLSQNLILYNANSSGAATSSQSFRISYSVNVGSLDEVNIYNELSGVTVTAVTSGLNITIANGASPNGIVTVEFIDNTNDYYASVGIPIAPNKQGAQGSQGEQGKIGRFFYYAGVFNRSNTSDTFVVSDVQAPYFRDSAYASTFHVYNGTNGTYTMSQMWENSSRSFNNKPFESMTTQFKYIITEAVFSSNAHLGSFIVSGDWLISQYGTFYDEYGNVHDINASTHLNPFDVEDGDETHTITEYNAYTWFDAGCPNSYNGDFNFCPAFAVDGLTGKTYQQEAYISGKVNATGINLGQYTIDTSVLTTISRPGTYTISPLLASQHGILDLELDVDGFEVGDIITIVHPMANGGYYYDNAVPAGVTFSDGIYMHFYPSSGDTQQGEDARMFQPTDCGGIYVRADSDIWGIGGLVPMMDANGNIRAYGFYPTPTTGTTGDEIQIYFSGGTLELMVMLNEDGNKVFYVKSRQCMYLQAVMNEGLSIYPTVIESCGRVVACYTSNETWSW